MVPQPAGEVVGAQDRHLRGLAQAVAAHHGDVGPRDGQDAGRSPGSSRDRPRPGGRAGLGDEGMVGQVGREVGADRHRADAGPAAAVGDAEGLVQVQVGHVGAEAARPGHADERVEVGAVEVDLATAAVDRVADVADGGLEHAVGRGVGDHQARQASGVLVDLGPQIVEVDVAVVVAGHDHDVESRHRRAGRVGAVRRCRDQAQVAVLVAAARRGTPGSPAVRPARPGSRRWVGATPRRSR